ncbi:three-finger toxin 3b-like isoform X2 [Palaemon carinicauda]|uniref:three-finger toxin 3b-like isoform X2 n=1 Tax=Palaemon carinicauda TaxID=392227 RepID=UPI0035B64A82
MRPYVWPLPLAVPWRVRRSLQRPLRFFYSRMFSLPMKVVAIAIVAFAVFQTGYCLQCYLGDEGTTTTVPCSGSCLKTTGKFKGSEVSVYSCSLLNHAEECSSGTYHEVTAEICYCNTDLCNSSSVSTVALPLLLGALLMKLVI